MQVLDSHGDAKDIYACDGSMGQTLFPQAGKIPTHIILLACRG